MPEPLRWLLFVHQLPPKPDYLRVKVRRRLKGIGAALLKSSVYVLPNTNESLEDFQWLREEIVSAGGSAFVAEAALVEGISDEEVEGLLVAERAGSMTEATRADERMNLPSGRVWVTRQGVFVDRIASAWLIKRFIDADARFRFVPARGYVPKRGELTFDMVGAEYTHVGEDCTFQTLLSRFGIREPALVTIGEIVHDIDCKDDTFDHPETAGVHGLLRGIAESTSDDHERLERGSAVFENLYSFFNEQREKRR